MSIPKKRRIVAIAALLGAGALLPMPADSEALQPNGAPDTRPLDRGDLVELRSGSPAMTIVYVAGVWVSCIWTDYVGRPHARTFPSYTLRKTDAAKP
jgi:uncharacterized protein YodC (DUF2158 family)